MHQIQGCNGLEPLSQVNFQKPQKNKSLGKVLNSSNSISSKKSKEAAVLHALAEKGRRKRINEHLETLRDFFPQLAKKQKASVLMEAVQRLKELRKKVAEHVALEQDAEGCCNGGWSLFLPGEKDEVKVSFCEGGGGGEEKLVKAAICCEDRERLNSDLTEAVRSIKGRLVKAEMATVGGRTKAVLVVQLCKESGGGGEEDVRSLRMALKTVVEDGALTCPVLLGPSSMSSRWADLGHNTDATFGSVNNKQPI